MVIWEWYLGKSLLGVTRVGIGKDSVVTVKVVCFNFIYWVGFFRIPALG